MLNSTNHYKEGTMQYFKVVLSSIVVVFFWVSNGFAISLVEAEWLKKELGGKNIRIVDVSSIPIHTTRGMFPARSK